MADFTAELKWRGMIQDMMPGTAEFLNNHQAKAYVGFDPTAASLGIGNMVPIMLLVHLQRCGHLPVALVGGATAMIGDPSGKSAERNLLSKDELAHNVEQITKQLASFMQFEGDNKAELLNNFDWFSKFGYLEFLRDVGKHLTISYMMSKDSVKSRMESGISYTEFSYQLLQGYDFYYLNKEHGVNLQMGGSDQWGNMTTGTELIRRMGGGEAYAITTPLITKSDGSKFGKSEGGNIWLDAKMTSPYKFYQFWLNAADDDIQTYTKIFSLIRKEEYEGILSEHEEKAGARIMQKHLAEEMTVRLHGQGAYDNAVNASRMLFGRGSKEDLFAMNSQSIKEVFGEVPSVELSKEELSNGMNVIDFAVMSGAYKSKGEARRMLDGGGLKINFEKVDEQERNIDMSDAANGEIVVVQKGKKNFFAVFVK